MMPRWPTAWSLADGRSHLRPTFLWVGWQSLSCFFAIRGPYFLLACDQREPGHPYPGIKEWHSTPQRVPPC